MGKVPRVLLPTLKQKAVLPMSYQKVCERYPIGDRLLEENGKFLYKKVVSKDPNAEQLATKYKASIVLSSSSIKTLCDILAENCSSYWELPVVIKEYKDNANVWKVVYIDRILPPKGMPAYQRNKWYHKYALKRLFIHPKFGKTHAIKDKFEIQQHPIRETTAQDDDCFGSQDISHLETFGNEVINRTNNELSETHFNSAKNLEVTCKEISSQSDSDNEILVIDTSACSEDEPSTSCASEKKLKACPASVNEASEDCDKNLTADKIEVLKPGQGMMTRSRAHALLKSTEKIEKYFQNFSPAKTEAEDSRNNILKKVFGESSSDNETEKEISSPSKKKKCLAANLKENSYSRPLVVKNKISGSKMQENPLDQILALQEETLKGKRLPTCSMQSSKNEINNHNSLVFDEMKLSSPLEESKNFVPPPSEKNITYGLWLLGDLTLLIRCSVDGKIPSHTTGCQPDHYCMLFPKLDYQCAYGGEITTESEKIQQWISSKIRLNCKTIKVRINPSNSEILAIEENLLKDFPPSIEMKALSTLYEILSTLNGLPPDQYLLLRRSEENNLKIYKFSDSPKRGDLDLHSSFTFFLEEAPASLKEVPWLPIDSSVFFRHHRIKNWIPGTFEAQDKQKGFSKRRKKKKC